MTQHPEEFVAEIARLQEIIRALMDRAERSTSMQGSDFGVFQTTVMLESQVRARTAELEAASRANESITRALRESDAKFRSVLDQSLVGIVLVEDGKLSYANEKFGTIFGYAEDEIRNIELMDLVVERDRAAFDETLREWISGPASMREYRGLRKDGIIIEIECHISLMRVGRKSFLVGLIMDITRRKRAEREVVILQNQLREQSTHDSLTGLYNRRYLDESLAGYLVSWPPQSSGLLSADPAGHEVTVIMGDLDHFKAVNDRYGHLAGDEVLRSFAKRMQRNARATDICCRYGGEEFILVLPRASQSAGVVRAETLRQVMESTPVQYGDASITVTVSFGVATFPYHGRTADELIGAADTALYAGKAGGRNRVMAAEATIDDEAKTLSLPDSPAGVTGRSLHADPTTGEVFTVGG